MAVILEKDREDKIKRIKELTGILNEAAKAYYSESREIMTNYEYDGMYDELARLENETGYVMSQSPTKRVGYEVVSELPKETHPAPMLSLDKTKNPQELAAWLKDKKGILSWKMDGLTIVLTYNNGVLEKAVTRGNGEVGEVITNNARVFTNVPISIPFMGNLVIRGEAVIKYSDFEKINEEITDDDQKYKNPRNLCSGSVRQLNNEITAKRNVNFVAFALVNADGEDFNNSVEVQFDWLSRQGFTVVEHKAVYSDTVMDEILNFEKKIPDNDYPSDGLVLMYDDIEYGRSLGRTAKFPRNAMAFKWQDETAQTTLKYIEWSPSRTGLINPVAVFEPVELEGTTVSRASVHNISIMEELELGAGDTISVYKANMIIPQIAENLTRSGVRDIPERCPVCGEKTTIRQVNSVKSLYCTNEKCQVKHVKGFAHFVSRDAMNIDGLSEASLEKFIGMGFIKEYADLYHLDRYKAAIVSMEGFGEKSYDNLIEAVNASRKTTLAKVIYSLGISNIGLSNAKMICRHFDDEQNAIFNASTGELTAIEGVGEVIADSFVQYFADSDNMRILNDLLPELEIIKEDKKDVSQLPLNGMTFVITGSVEHYANRNELKEVIEANGGKATGSVTSKTNYLINNDATSASSKNKKAKELGVTIITEEQFMQMVGMNS